MSPPGRLATARRDFPWDSLRICVAGVGVSGSAAADVLCRLGADVVAVDGRDGDAEREQAHVLETLGVRVVLGSGAAEELPEGTDLVVTSPGWRPGQPLLAAAAANGVPVWGEVELAWRLRPEEGAAPWLCLTGTNGKTTTVRMLTAMLTAGGARAVAAGNVGLPLLDAVLADPPYGVIAVELSSFQLHWSQSLRPLASAVLNVAPDHVDWHGSVEAYTAAKGRIFERTERVRVYNASDPVTEHLARAADLGGARTIGFTLGAPAAGQLGVLDDHLVDRAFLSGDEPAAAPHILLAAVSDVSPPAPHNIENALAAAALARAYGVPPAAVREGLRRFRPDPHRIATVATVGGVTWVDDSKATNPHAAGASLRAFDRIVWVAGGLAKGANFDDLASVAAGRLRGAVLLGRDRAAIREALARHAPDVPVVEVSAHDTGRMADVMDSVVRAAARVARPGDTVLFAPACASMDMFADYGERGDAFAAAVQRLGHEFPGSATPRRV